MRAFYEKIDEAVLTKTPAEAIGKLAEAYALGVPLVARARARCEFGTVTAISGLIRWAAMQCAWKLLDGPPPPIDLWLLGGSVWGRVAKVGTSSTLDFRWSQYAELPETWLPSVPLWTRGPC